MDEIILGTESIESPWYVCEIRGAVFVTWVQASDKAHALRFPLTKYSPHEWCELILKLSGQKVGYERVSSRFASERSP